MKVTLHVAGGPAWHERYIKAFTAGFAAHDIGVSRTHVDRPIVDGSIPLLFACNSFKRCERFYKNNDVPFLTVNRCFVLDVNDDVAIGWGGFNGEADFKLPEKPSVDRWHQQRDRCKLTMFNWAPTGRARIVLGDYEHDRNRKLVAAIKDDWKTDGMLWKPHPQNHTNYGFEHFRGTLRDACRVASFMCVYSTTAVAEAMLLGIPCITYSRKSIAYPVTGHGPVDFRLPDRNEWFSKLAYAQWHITEIESGAFWEHLR